MCKSGNSLRDTKKGERKRFKLKSLLSEHKEDVAHFDNVLYRLDSCTPSHLYVETILQ